MQRPIESSYLEGELDSPGARVWRTVPPFFTEKLRITYATQENNTHPQNQATGTRSAHFMDDDDVGDATSDAAGAADPAEVAKMQRMVDEIAQARGEPVLTG